MAIDVGQADVDRVFRRYHATYEVRPYYVLLEQRPPGAPSIEKRIHAGFDVDLFGTLEKAEMPSVLKEEGDLVIGYFETLAREVQSEVAQNCTVEVIRYPDSLVFDPRLQPQAMIRIRISHSRGVDQTEGPAEERALQAIRAKLQELGTKEM